VESKNKPMKKNVFVLCILTIFIFSLSCSAEDKDADPAIMPVDDPALKDEPRELTENEVNVRSMNIKIEDKVLTATLVDNSSVEALMNLLSEGPITVNMRDYGNMEKVGRLPQDLPRNDKQITAQPGDIILYQGSALVIYYAPNSWNFTRLGKIDNITQEELKAILGEGNVTVTLSLAQD
jgi:hypothetical protein